VAGSEPKVVELKDSGDERGSSFPSPEGLFEDGFTVRDVHLSTLLPGHVRGNHFHITRRETLIVMSEDRWSLYWDTGAQTSVVARVFDGLSAVLIQIPPHASHAIRNDGSVPLHIVGLTNGPYDPAAPDAYPRRVTDR
jgi:dTDP-4-dehydrorhamnose 3,5-epimerase-like enzyme